MQNEKARDSGHVTKKQQLATGCLLLQLLQMLLPRPAQQQQQQRKLQKQQERRLPLLRRRNRPPHNLTNAPHQLSRQPSFPTNRHSRPPTVWLRFCGLLLAVETPGPAF